MDGDQDGVIEEERVVNEEPLVQDVIMKHSRRSKTDGDQKTVDFRVALELSKYGFGAMYTAKQLLRSRGMVQSWKKMGERHYLARKNFSTKNVSKRLWKIRRMTTFKDIDYHLATRLFNYDLSSSYIALKLDMPISTVNSWRKGNSPSSVREGFIDMELVDRKFESLLRTIMRDLTEDNIDYFLSRKISRVAKERREKEGARGIGARTISAILKRFLNTEPLPERTVSSWIKGERCPHNIDQRLVDEEYIEERFDELVLELTKEHIDYHVTKELEHRGWGYSALALFMNLDKEKVRGWVKKGRGSPVAKTFMKRAYVLRVVKTMLGSNSELEEAMACDMPELGVKGRRKGRGGKGDIGSN